MSSHIEIHPTAVVDKSARIGEGSKIGPFCVIGPRVVIGQRNVLKSHVVIEGSTTMGDDNEVFPFAYLGAAPADLKYKGEETKLIIGSHNKIRESTSLHIGTQGGGGRTVVGDHNLLMAYTHLGHDTIIGNHVIIANGCQLAGHVTVEDWAILGGLSAVSQFCRVGAHSYVGGCSGVDRDVIPFSLGKGPTGSFQILGLNLVGLRRRGFTNDRIGVLMEALKLFLNKDIEKNTVLERLTSEFQSCPEAQIIAEFVRSSEVGVFR